MECQFFLQGADSGYIPITLAAQPVDAIPFNRLIRQYFPKRTDLYDRTQSEPKQGFRFV